MNCANDVIRAARRVKNITSYIVIEPGVRLDYIETEMITSLATIVLVILCIGVFIAYGANLDFYAIAAVTVVIGLANAWLIARQGKAPKAAAKAAPKRRRKR
jgi:hypothetical protein